MSVLVIAEHNNKFLKASTLNTVKAALEIDAEVHVLVCGFNNDEVVKQTSAIEGIIKVLQINDDLIEHQLAEQLSQVLVQISKNYTHILAPSTTFGKKFHATGSSYIRRFTNIRYFSCCVSRYFR